MIKIRLSGLLEDIEVITRELRRTFEILKESDSYVNRKSKLVRRYLLVRSPVENNTKQDKPTNQYSDSEILMARSLRLAVVQNQFDQGNLTEDDAKELLSGPLTPGDDNSIFDDSGELRIK